jgi:hypothetical protein
VSKFILILFILPIWTQSLELLISQTYISCTPFKKDFDEIIGEVLHWIFRVDITKKYGCNKYRIDFDFGVNQKFNYCLGIVPLMGFIPLLCDFNKIISI